MGNSSKTVLLDIDNGSTIILNNTSIALSFPRDIIVNEVPNSHRVNESDDRGLKTPALNLRAVYDMNVGSVIGDNSDTMLRDLWNFYKGEGTKFISDDLVEELFGNDFYNQTTNPEGIITTTTVNNIGYTGCKVILEVPEISRSANSNNIVKINIKGVIQKVNI